MPERFIGNVEITDKAGKTRIVLETDGKIHIHEPDFRERLRFNPEFGVLDIGGGGSNGDIRIHDDKDEVRIHLDGHEGDVKLLGADCAEDFDVGEVNELEPGTVMVIGQNGTLQPCNSAYDRRVAGVVSGAGGCRPGIILDKRASTMFRRPIALAGKVFCKVQADLAPIEVGDLLTTSAISGHAMKVSDPQQAFGAVIGKALEAMRSGKGLIPILVALQ